MCFIRPQSSLSDVSVTQVNLSSREQRCVMIFTKNGCAGTARGCKIFTAHGKVQEQFPITTGKNNRFPFLDILGYLKNTHKNPNQGTWLGIPWLGLVSLCQIWNFFWEFFKYPKMTNIGNLLFFPLHQTHLLVPIFFSSRPELLRLKWVKYCLKR